MDQISLFTEAAVKTENRLLSRLTWMIHVAAQGKSKDVKEQTDALLPEGKKQPSAEEILRDRRQKGKRS